MRPSHEGAMLPLAMVDAARLTSLASGRGGIPTAAEWPIILFLLGLLAFVGTRVLLALGLTKLESILVAGVAPIAVLIDAPLLPLTPNVQLAANLAGCLIPAFVGVKILLSSRAPVAEGCFLLGTAIVVSFFSSHVEPDRGVLLQYRIPAIVVGFLAAGLLYRKAERAGAAAFAAGGLGVIIGADIMHLGDLAAGAGAGRVILGGAGLLDGILLVALLAAAVAELLALCVRALLRTKVPSEPTV